MSTPEVIVGGALERIGTCVYQDLGWGLHRAEQHHDIIAAVAVRALDV